jgi:integrase
MPNTKLESFVGWLRKSGYREATIRVYRRVIKKALDCDDLSDILKAGKLSRTQRTQALAALRQYANYIGGGTGEEVREHLRSLPRQRFPEPSPERPLMAQEWTKLREAVGAEDEPLRWVLGLLCTTGLRVGDIGHICRENVEEAEETDVLYLDQKGGRSRPYPWEHVKGSLKPLLAYEGWKELWQAVSPSSFDAYYMAVSRGLRRAAHRAKLDPKKIHPHILRKTVAQHLLRETDNIVLVQKMLGHKKIETTQKYVAYTEPDELEAIADKLPRMPGEERNHASTEDHAKGRRVGKGDQANAPRRGVRPDSHGGLQRGHHGPRRGEPSGEDREDDSEG